ncbi:V-type ATP synthase subunit F [Chloroflexota bacterium]
MMQMKQLGIAIIGDEDLINGLRLGGVSKYIVIDDNKREAIRKALTQFIDDSDVGIIVIQEDYMEHVDDMVTNFKKQNMITPIIIEVPSKYGTKYEDAAEYYKKRVRESIGFEIEI